jgi:hypothetical protein
MLIEEIYTDYTNNLRLGESGIFKPFTEDIGELFKSLQSEYGRCISKVYIDIEDKACPIGWVFQKRVKYDDCNETYLRSVWVTLHNEKPTVKTTYNYHFLN